MRILAAVLCFCVVCTTYPNILETLSVIASADADAARITAFVQLPKEVQNQTVAPGTKQEELALPDTLEAYIEQSDTEQSDTEQSDTQQSDTEQSDTQQSDTKPDTEQSDPPETKQESDTIPPTTEPETKQEPDTATEPETKQEPDTATEPETKQEPGTIPPTTVPETKQEPDTTTVPETKQEPEPTPKPESDEKTETHTVTLPTYEAQNKITVNTLQTTNGESAPQPTGESAPENNGESAPVTIENITWTSAPVYDKDREGIYTFTAVLPKGYTTADGVSLPQITVEVTQDAAWQQELQALLTLLRALPNPEDYLTYNKTTQTITENKDLIEEPKLTEARAAADAYIQKYPAENELLSLLTRLEGLEHIRDTKTDCMDFDCPYHYPQSARDLINQDETPDPLTLEDLVEDYGVEPTVQPKAYSKARAAVTHPRTLMITDDNENNSHTGTADGDIDSYMSGHNAHAPIELSFTLDELPTQSAYLAIKAYDVDEDYGETDYVYLNDDIFLPVDCTNQWNKPYNAETIGYLSGTNNTWNTTILEIPLQKLKKGKNVISVTIASSWLVKVDWMQLILDGGTKDNAIEEFSIKLRNAINNGDKTTVDALVIIKQTGTTEYATEYTLICEETGDALDACFGTASADEKVSLTMPLDSPSGRYKITGILKNADTEEIKATDTVSFDFIQGEGANVLLKTSHTLTPAVFTNQNVEIRVKAEPMDNSVTNITVQDNGKRTVTQNGAYDFTVSYQQNGEAKSRIYTVNVTNIDKEPPEIDYAPITVSEDMDNAQAKKLFEQALHVTDNMTQECEVSYTFPNPITDAAIKVTAKDKAGNQTTKDCPILILETLKIGQPTATRQGTSTSFTLSAKLEGAGGKTITESGFVWGTMQNPTVTLNQGSAKSAVTAVKKNDAIKVTAADIISGVHYYARAYAKADNTCYYSSNVAFNIGAKQYGAFTIKNNGNNTFTVTRTNGTEGTQKVYYRTVNGSAAGGTHFTHRASSLTFTAGETTKTISITERGVNTAYGSKTATAYTNADRTYQVELYRVTGGATLGDTVRATRTMTKGSAYTVNRNVYSEKQQSFPTNNDNNIVADRSKTKDHQPFFRNNRGYNQSHGQLNFNVQRTFSISGSDKEKAYIKATADGYYYRLRFKGREDSDGYEHIWIADHKPNNFDSANEHNGAINIDDNLFGAAKYTARWDIDNGKTATITVPGANMRSNLSGWRESARSGAEEGDYIAFGFDDEVNVWFASTGSATDKWRVNTYNDWIKVKDSKEPQLLAVAPMAGGIYKAGDAVTVSLIFDEIVDKKNSALDNVSIDTSWGNFAYAGGADTNVLYFKGTVPANATGTLKVTKINNAANIKDMCDTSGKASGGTGSASVTVDTKTPVVSVTNPTLISGTASGTITASNADTLRYAWSDSAVMPVDGWFSCKSGYRAGTRRASGKWYLHVMGERNNNGAVAHAYHEFDFGTPENPTSPLPELIAAADNTNWARSREVKLTKRPADAPVTARFPDGSTQSLKNTDTTFSVDTNGVCTVTMTAGDEVITQDVTIEKIDRDNPTLTLTKAGSVDAVYNKLVMAATAQDALSGIKTVQYAFTTSQTAPANGWQTADDSSKTADGKYAFTYTATQTARTKIYLHVKVTDAAGNSTAETSEGYTVIKEPASASQPQITLTVPDTNWTNQDVTLTWKLTATGAGGCTVYADDKMLTNQSVNATGTITASKNGIYTVSVVDQNGASADATLVVNHIDKEPPTLEDPEFLNPKKWARYKQVSFSIVEDTGTPQYNEKGAIGNSGSGLQMKGDFTKFQFQMDNLYNGAWQNVASLNVGLIMQTNGTYRLRITDNAGNVTEKSVVVDGIDKTRPEVTATVNATKNASGWYTDTKVPVTLEFTDPANGAEGGVPSGIDTVQYKWVTDTTTKPTTGLTSVPASTVKTGACTANLTQAGTWYLYYKVTDAAGNTKDGYSEEIKKDHYKGGLVSLTGPAQSQAETDGLAMTVKVNYGPSGAELTATGQTAPIGTLAPHNSVSAQSGTASYTTKTIGTNYIYIKPASWGSRYYWTYYVRRITFNSQGGSEVPNQLVWTRQSSTSTSAAVDCALVKPTDPTRTGYTFGGWYTDAACTNGNEFDFDNQTQIRTDTTLYAKWTADEYQVTYTLKSPNGKTSGEYVSQDTGKSKYTYGQIVELPIPTIDDITEKPPAGFLKWRGIVFDGWYVNENCTGRKYTSIGAEATGDKHYWGKWLDIEEPRSINVNYTNILLSNGWWRKASETKRAYRYWRVVDNVEPAKICVQWNNGEWREQPVSSTSDALHIYEEEFLQGINTYRCKAVDAAGHESKIYEGTFQFDSGKPTLGSVTISPEPTQIWVADNSQQSVYTTQKDGTTPVKVFKEPPTISISAADSVSGLWKLTYKKTSMSWRGTTIKEETLEVDLRGQGKSATVPITLEPNWRGTLTEIQCYDLAGNILAIDDIGEIIVDTTPPIVKNFHYNGYDSSSGFSIEEDNYYDKNEVKYVRAFIGDIPNVTSAIGSGVRSYEYTINGVKTGFKTDWSYGITNSNLAVLPVEGNSNQNAQRDHFSGICTVTIRVTDYAGNVTTKSQIIKFAGKEDTPGAGCNYPQDTLTGLSPNTAYAVTVGSKTYAVTTDAQGEIPFVLPTAVTGGAAVDLCGKTISVVKKGNGVQTQDSDAQTLTVSARPPAYSGTVNIEAEVLKDAEDAQINFVIAADGKTWEYKAPGGTWTDVPADGAIKNLPKGNLLLRVKAKAQTTATPDNGNPHGIESTHVITSQAGTITAQFDLNDSTGTPAQNRPADQTGLTYKSKLTEPAAPTRTGYDFIGWYHTGNGYQAGSTADTAWRFTDQENAKANTVGEILGTDKTKYAGNCTKVENGVYYVKLCADWRENVKPNLTASLSDGKNAKDWHNALTITLTYSDNVGVTKLYGKRGSEEYRELTINTNGTTIYTDLEEGSHTYTFKAEDAAGNVTETKLTAKLDTVKPILGEAAFSEGHKSIWDWIIKKDSLFIEIPITETGSGVKQVDYTLTPETGTAVTGTAKILVSGSKKTAQITIAADFKGAISVTAADNAGNISDEKKIGAAGTGLNGVIVESNAPTVTIQADRTTTDEQGGTNSVALSETDYYNTAPRLRVHVEDKEPDTAAVNAGIASVTWQINDEAEYSAGANFDITQLTQYDLTITALEGRTGDFTVTIRTCDQAGNEGIKIVTVHVKTQAEMPVVGVDYRQELLTGLTAGASYDIQGETVTADAQGNIPIRENWFGTQLQVRRKGDGQTQRDSDNVTQEIAPRPDAPGITVEQDETIRGKHDAQLSGIDATMEYSIDGGATWTAVQDSDLSGGKMTNAHSTIMLFRVKATDSAPHGNAAEIEPNEGRTLTVSFDAQGGSSVSPITDNAWHDTVEKPKEPARAGYAFAGWYQESACTNQWHFADEAAADMLEDDITLYAKWQDDEQPALTAVLTDNSRTNQVEEKQWSQALAIVLTYADNENVTKLSVKQDDGAYVTLGESAAGAISGSAEDGKSADGYPQFRYEYDNIAEGAHTYTFQVQDAAGKTTETTVTARLDTTKPVFSTVSYNEGYQNFLDWIIHKEKLLITVPVTETGSGVAQVTYTLTPTDSNADTIKGTAEVKKAQGSGADYEAVIGIEPTFKGSITIEGADNVGNIADTKTIGTNGGGINGVIVEDNAPLIAVLADRDVTDEAPQPTGIALSQEYYNHAPALTVSVTDQIDDSINGLITGGIASVTWQLGDGAAQNVTGNYETEIVTDVSFTIPAEKIPTGITVITVTAADHAGNRSVQELTIKVKEALPAPQAAIGYTAETLKGLTADTTYRITVGTDADNSVALTAGEDGTIPIEEDWLGKTLTIVQISGEDAKSDSAAQSIAIPTRPAAPVLGTEQESHPLEKDGKITGLDAGRAYEISEDGGQIWKWRDADVTGTEITGLAGSGSGSDGTYHVRIKAVDNADGNAGGMGNFAGKAAIVTIATGDVIPYPKPDLKIDYRKETLTSLLEDAEYIIEYENNSEPVSSVYTAEEEDTLPIEEDWLDKDHKIIRSGYGIPGMDSEPQNLRIPARPQTPAVAAVDETAPKAQDGRLTGLTAGTVYEISTDDGETWEAKTAGADGELTGLAPARYIVRKAATDTSFASLPSETVKIHGSYAVVLEEGVGYTLTAQAGSASPVKEGGSFGFAFALAEGYQKADSFAVKVNGEKVELAADNTYTITDVTEDKTVTVEGVEKTPVYYTVTLEGGTGYTLTAVSGSASPVKEGESFGFAFALKKGYRKTNSFAVKVNGATVELTAEDTYTITDIMEDKTVTVEGVKKKSSGGSSGGSDGGNNGGNSGGTGNGGSTPAIGNPPANPQQPTNPLNPDDPLNPVNPTNPTDDSAEADKKANPKDDGTGTDKKTNPKDDGTETDKTQMTETVNPTDETAETTEASGQEQAASQDSNAQSTQTVPVTIENGALVQSGGEPVTTGSPAQTEFTTTILKTEKQGAVIVTVVCEDKDYAAGVSDTVAAANAVLTSQQIQQVDNGEIIEIRIDVKDISATIAKQDKEAIETALAQYREEYPQLALGRYIDISMFLKTGAGDWDAVTATEKPIDVIIGVPTKLQEDNRKFYVIRAHEGQTTLLTDTDDNPDTITISTDRFSTYAIAYSQAAGAAKSSKCSLCHICPTFMGICCFIWLAILTVLVTIVLIIVFRRKDDRKKRH